MRHRNRQYRAQEPWMKRFLRIYTGQAFSLISSHAVQFSIIWWITQTTGSALSLTVATLVGVLPQALLGPFAGVWIDRYNRKTIMILADALTALASGALGLSFLIGTPSLVFVYLMLFVRAIGNTFHTPALQASLPSLVPAEALERAGGLGQTVNAFSNMISPLIGAFLLNILPLGGVMLLDIAGAALAILMIAGVDIDYAPVHKGGKVSVLHDMRQGFQCLARNKAILTVSVFVLLATVIFLPYGSLLPLMVRSHFGGNATQVGLAQTCYSVGLLAGSFVMGIMRKRHRTFLTNSLAFVIFGIFGFLSGLIPASGLGLF